ncbi:MAG: sensor histidine kinase, partial [Erysipelotrichaceae bacterium]|nr:sensor histidine kinase [Erysipelotrichaceae bacterium]
SIANDGPNIEEDRLKVLFKPYEKGQQGKFGLGLSIVAKVVQANHYEVSGENTSDGVIFRIYKRKS